MQSSDKLHQTIVWIGILVIAAILTGCSSTGMSPEGNDTATVPTAPITSSPSIPTVTPTSLPMRTLVPQFSPTPRLITPAPSEGTVIDNSLVSPDGQWTASPEYEDVSNGYHISLRIFNQDNSVVWMPVDYTGEGLGHMAPIPRRWSNDSRYLFYAESTVYDGCADFLPLEDTWQQLDVETGEVNAFPLPYGRGHQISPNEIYLAYTTAEEPLTLVILDLTTQAEKRAVLLPAETGKDGQGGRILWSPAGDELLLAVQTGNVCEGQKPAYFLLKVQVEDMMVSTLHQGEAYYAPQKWDESGRILIMDWSRRSWWIDAASGEVTTAP